MIYIWYDHLKLHCFYHDNVTMHKRCTAFTLAEIIIVLTIIGVIAVLTIPSLLQNTNNQEYVDSLKKFYAEANQALIQTAVDEGNPTKFNASDGNTLEADIADHFKKSKDCAYATTGDCWMPVNTKYDGTGSVSPLNQANDKYKFVTVDGMSVLIWIYSDANCRNLSSDPNAATYKYCGDMDVDVNGLKPPNRYGRDVFSFRITNNKSPLLYPWGGKNDDHYWGSYCNTESSRCTGRIIEESWQMNY